MLFWGLLLVVLAAACGGTDDSSDATDPLCADVLEVTIADASAGSTISVTVRSDDLGWEAYADRWEVVVGEEVIAERILLHPHENEQPFTRSVSGVDLPAEGDLLVRAHHSTGGFCGAELRINR